jgi:hypothetical protein
MRDWDRLARAFDVLESAEVMEEFEDCLWIRVNREDWEALKQETGNEGNIGAGLQGSCAV